MQRLKQDWARTAWEVSLAKWIAAAALAAFLANIGLLATAAYNTTTRLTALERDMNALEKRLDKLEQRQ
jgi:cell division protein FtsB